MTACAREGATVIATDVLDEAGENLAATLRADGLDVRYARLDVSSPGDWAALADSMDVVHGLVNNAGIAMRARLGEVELERRLGRRPAPHAVACAASKWALRGPSRVAALELA